ncbi:exonuclease SbcC [Gloeomargarita lithophora Alchichica-D10]|uniref:Nuclease SbcCD subunit C n=1 Tax=Gloeomargarita lithophora Alchichica-D10 TaxID=1188229 RepID=A0A1J0ADX5_9CYAN|nr:SMC family ATPase [Gloeomargarita lithophora]APB34140.1 exonuclease SbcC [Gloeomargarita lithophora Alchichica-D10]
MIPRQLTLNNFLSYRQASLDFSGLHTACICGPNGAGKSSLLEAMTWALWGESRAPGADDVIRSGCTEAQVDFSFSSGGQTYRVIRARKRGHTTLEFQVLAQERWQPLTQRAVKDTQDLINRELKLDYPTFIHSAYLRQGRADEFMLKTPSKRKEVLASLLQLDHYDELAEQAKKRANDQEYQAKSLQQTLIAQAQELAQEPEISQQYATLKQEIHTTQTTCDQLQNQLHQYQHQQQQRQQWVEQDQWLTQQRSQLNQDQTQTQVRQEQLRQQIAQLQHLLEQTEPITQAYQTYTNLQKQEEHLNQQSQQQQQLQQEYNQLQSEYQQVLHQLELQKQQLISERHTLTQNLQKQELIRQESPQIAPALVQLATAREQLKYLDQQAEQYKPLYEHYQKLRQQQEQTRARQEAQLQEQQRQLNHLNQQLTQLNGLDQELATIQQQLAELDKKKVYLDHVEEKGKERKSFQDSLNVRLQNYEIQIAQLAQKSELLKQPEALCPLCAHPLDAKHWQVVQKKQELERRELEEAIWLTKEQITVTGRELHILRQEYHQIREQCQQREPLSHKQGQLSQKRQQRQELQAQIQQNQTRIQAIQETLACPQINPELAQIEINLAAINYDENAHTCARGEVEKWRWVEIKQAEIQNAEKEYGYLCQCLHQLEQKCQDLDTQINEATHHSPLRYQLDRLQQQLADLAYDATTHQTIRQQMQQHQNAPLRYQELQQAQQEHPRLDQELVTLIATATTRLQRLEELAQKIITISTTLAQLPDLSDSMDKLATQIQAQQQKLQTQYIQSGTLQERLQQLSQLRKKNHQGQQELTRHEHQYQIYRTLTQAFGKNGIQALMIEQILPQLEATANHILGRLSNHQLHVRFITQKPKKSGSNKNQLIETLEIFIADYQGTRPYETYSGGEAFRVNFAIRLALARLLTQRAGATLQLLIVDEGFGTQDAQGCDRLIAAISAISDEYACILMVTHMPNLKEAFSTRIEVSKTEQGSQVQLLL